MRFFYSFLLLLFVTTTYSQNIRCFSYDAAGNRVTRVSGTCKAPSGLVASPDDLINQADAQSIDAKKEVQGQGLLADPTKNGLAGNIYGVVYPNPTSSKFTIAFDGLTSETDLLLELFDVMGRLVERRITADPSNDFDLSDQGPGFYFLFAKQSGHAPKSWKVIKQ